MALAAETDKAQDQALRFANALRWERGQRKESEDRANSLQAELVQARKLNKKLTSELQATSSLLNSAAKAAELLQKQKQLTKRAQSELAKKSLEMENLQAKMAHAVTPEERAKLATITPNVARFFNGNENNENNKSDEEGLIEALKRQSIREAEQADEMRKLQKTLAKREEELARLRSQANDLSNVAVRSPFRADPHGLLQSELKRDGAGITKALWSDDPASPAKPQRPQSRAALGSLDNRTQDDVNSISSAAGKRTWANSAPAAHGTGGVCTCGSSAFDAAGNFRCLGCPTTTTANPVAARSGDDGVDESIDLVTGEVTAGMRQVGPEGDGDAQDFDIDLARVEQAAQGIDERAARNGFGEGPVPGGHAPYYCTSLDCELAVVKRLTWPGGSNEAQAEDDDDPSMHGCGRALEGQLRFDSARFGAALDIVFTGSVEHLQDQEWQADEEIDDCPCCESSFGLLTRRHHCRVCGEIRCGDCVLRMIPHFVPDEEEDEEEKVVGGQEFRDSLALTVVDQDAEAPVVTGKVERASILACHSCFAMLQLLAVSQHGPEKSGLRFSMMHAGA